MKKSETILLLNKINVGYNGSLILTDFSLELYESDILLIIGPNGVGKSTLLKSIFGYVPIKSGDIFFNNFRINKLTPDQRAKLGISILFQDKKIFSQMTVEENLLVSFIKNGYSIEDRIENVYAEFPILFLRKNSPASQLSDGEQQQLAWGRILMQEPKLVLLDEPSSGLSNNKLLLISRQIHKISSSGISFIIVEHHTEGLIDIATHILNLENKEFLSIKNTPVWEYK